MLVFACCECKHSIVGQPRQSRGRRLGPPRQEAGGLQNDRTSAAPWDASHIETRSARTQLASRSQAGSTPQHTTGSSQEQRQRRQGIDAHGLITSTAPTAHPLRMVTGPLLFPPGQEPGGTTTSYAPMERPDKINCNGWIVRCVSSLASPCCT